MSLKTNSSNRNFHLLYLDLCKFKNRPALTCIKRTNKLCSLDFFGDQLRHDDWIPIIGALNQDSSLHSLAIRFRKPKQANEAADAQQKIWGSNRETPGIKKIIFEGIIKAITNCIQNSQNLTTICLEGVRIDEGCLSSIMKALSKNRGLKDVKFTRSPIGDNGCKSLCDTIKSLPNIHTLDVSACNLTSKGALYVAEMIKFQKICRYSEGWMKSLRYRNVDPVTVGGLKEILLNNNPSVLDDGVAIIAEELKDDVWIKVIEMQNCGIMDSGAANVLLCLETNSTLTSFNIENNSVSPHIMKKISAQFSVVNQDTKEQCKWPVKESIHVTKQGSQMAKENAANRRLRSVNLNLHKIQETQQEEFKDDRYEIACIDPVNQDLPSSTSLRKGMRRTRKIRRVKSEAKLQALRLTLKKFSKSEHRMSQLTNTPHIFVERNAGDCLTENIHIESTAESKIKQTSQLNGEEALRMIMHMKKENQQGQMFSPLSLFVGKKD